LARRGGGGAPNEQLHLEDAREQRDRARRRDVPAVWLRLARAILKRSERIQERLGGRGAAVADGGVEEGEERV
jgi:hypothetical protein